jgi:hypothetical protein
MKQRPVIQSKHKYTQSELKAFERGTRKLFQKCIFFNTQRYFILNMNIFLYTVTLDEVEIDLTFR